MHSIMGHLQLWPLPIQQPTSVGRPFTHTHTHTRTYIHIHLTKLYQPQSDRANSIYGRALAGIRKTSRFHPIFSVEIIHTILVGWQTFQGPTDYQLMQPPRLLVNHYLGNFCSFFFLLLREIKKDSKINTPLYIQSIQSKHQTLAKFSFWSHHISLSLTIRKQLDKNTSSRWLVNNTNILCFRPFAEKHFYSCEPTLHHSHFSVPPWVWVEVVVCWRLIFLVYSVGCNRRMCVTIWNSHSRVRIQK